MSVKVPPMSMPSEQGGIASLRLQPHVLHRRHEAARHRLHERVVHREQNHVRRVERLRVGGVQPAGGERAEKAAMITRSARANVMSHIAGLVMIAGVVMALSGCASAPATSSKPDSPVP